jgi:hypothetical protein
MVKISKFGEDFLLLALRIGKHIKEYVDFYIGPENLKQIVENESIISPNKLLNDSQTLIKKLETQGFNKQREKYVKKLLIAMETSIEVLIGAEISFRERFLRTYDVALQPGEESDLNDLKEEFNIAYEGSGSLGDRLSKLRELRKIPKSDVLVLFKKALKIVKNRTKELFPNLLPQKEQINIELIENKNNYKAKWSYYEWYLGNNTSRIEVNPNYNMYWSSILDAAAHEGYPGHHTEFVMKENLLYREKFQFEHSILLLNSPTLIISEGIATTALNTLYSYQNQAEISLKEFCSNANEEAPLYTLFKQYRVKRKLEQFSYNLAYHALLDDWSEEKLIQYATSFEIFSKEDIKNRMKLLKDPVHSTTIFAYYIGNKLISDKFSEFPSIKNFINLLIKPILPSDLE